MSRPGLSPWLAALLFLTRAGAAEPVRRAVLVGINTYQWSGPVHKIPAEDFPNLTGAAGDAIWLKSILTSKYGFRDQDIVVLTDLSATRSAIVSAFRSQLIEKSRGGDVALFYFAGHGSQQPLGNEVENTIVPADSRDPEGKVFDLGSSELHELFVALLRKSENVISVLDTCYSDTAVRDDRPKRSIKMDARVKPKPLPASGPTRALDSVGNPVDRIIRISASRSDQEAAEYTEYAANGRKVKHGLLSYQLFGELEKAGAQATWRDVVDRTRTKVLMENPLQEPQWEAPNADVLVFGGAGQAASEPFFLVTPQRQLVLLNGGSLHSLAEGTGLSVYPPGTHEFTGKPLSELKVTNVADTSSEAVVVSGIAARDLPEGATAVVRSRPPSAFRFRIFFDGESPAKADIRQRLFAAVPETEEASRDTADAVVRFADGKIHTEWRAGGMMSPPLDAAASDAVQTLVRQIRAWSRWRRLLKGEGARPVLALQITGVEGGILSEVSNGTPITIRLCNGGTRPYFTRVVFFASDGAITPLDLATDGRPLAAGECRTGGSFRIAVDEPRTRSVDFFRAFATVSKVDFEPFASGQIRDGIADPSEWSATTSSLIVNKR